MASGTHLCLIYDSEDERREVVAKFVRDGLTGGERVAYFTDADPADIRGWLADHGVALPDDAQFDLTPARAVYCPDGEFVPERMPSYWHAFYDEAGRLGFPAARATGETSWSRDVPGGDRIVEYEARLNDVLAELPVTALCQYDVKRFDGATILDIMRVHPLMIIGGHVVTNSYYMRPEEFLGRSARTGKRG